VSEPILLQPAVSGHVLQPVGVVLTTDRGSTMAPHRRRAALAGAHCALSFLLITRVLGWAAQCHAGSLFMIAV
jgi:hypothetical protein